MAQRECSQGKPRGKGEIIHLKSFLFKDITLLQLHTCQEWCQKSGTKRQYQNRTLRSSGIGKIYKHLVLR